MKNTKIMKDTNNNQSSQICPCCGEMKMYFWDDDNIGVEKLLPIERHTEKLFSLQVSIVEMYKCHTCGHEWEKVKNI